MRVSDATLVQVAAVGPAIAGLMWLALIRWPWVRRAIGGALWLGAHAAAWAVFWRLYSGEAVGWRGLEPELLRATIVPIAEIGILLALIRAEALQGRAAIAAVVGLMVSTSAVVVGGYSTSLAGLALLVPIPTLAAAAASLAGSTNRRRVAGLGGLAGADLLAVVGFAVLLDRSGSSTVTPLGGIGLGSALLLLAGAAKTGAVPGVGTWRLTASADPVALVTPALRGQGVVLIALAGPLVAGMDDSLGVASAAAVAALGAGIVGIARSRARTSLAAVCGAAAALPFLAVGLGGSIGLRAFLLLFPAFLLGSGIAMLLGWAGPEEHVAGRRSRLRRWVGGAALGVSLASLVGLPPAGGFPGVWLTLGLATARGTIEPLSIGLAGAAALGLVAAAVAAIPLVRAVRPAWIPVIVGAAGAALLLYMGSLPVRVGAGWWLRVEEGLDSPRLLSFVGAPGLPPVTGTTLLAAGIAAAIPVLLVIVLGRGFRDAGGTFDGVPAPEDRRRQEGALMPLARKLQLGTERLYLGMAAASLVEVAAVWSIIRLVTRAGRQGFL
jgi:hypothetical protein